ncbi:hypothetical protein SAMN05444395_1103 [Flavobacterium fryxellicola]|uniref:Flagellar motor protein MotB n=1 Tax=Flavobacterium fryxellicola TaxID=249352 RepID=A0A167ZDR7_9FLAO|nr:flagellar motor protein MotB [Flavobacterium fryxellicola]OAB30348.1 flagellar motor protein MotB [Flavobacterium fryxellicola]SHN75875.1 hypothetical protein SAMN05444395_1103 [Flavobacterium fryxellicola]
MKKNIFFCIILSSLIYFKGNAQESKLYTTEKASDKYACVDVIKTYERIAEKGYKSADLFKTIGDSYYLNADFGNAAKWYCELFAMGINLEPEYYHQYSKSLLFIGQNDSANEILEKLKQKSRLIQEK